MSSEDYHDLEVTVLIRSYGHEEKVLKDVTKTATLHMQLAFGEGMKKLSVKKKKVKK